MRILNTQEVVQINGIPITHVKPKGMTSSSSVPTVFIYHGWASCKENYLFVADILSTYGYQVIIPDAPLHGERLNERNLQADFWKVIIQSVEEFSYIFNLANKQWCVTAEKTAVVGSSMGGFTATGIFAQNLKLKCLVSINGSGAWEESEHLFRTMDGRTPPNATELTEIRKYDPVRYVKNLPVRPVLLQHGDSDGIIPDLGQKKFCEELSIHYGEKHRHLVQFQEIPRMNHYISLGMCESMINWIDTFLN